MITEGFEQWFKLNKAFTGPINDWGKAATEICQRTAQQNLEMFGDNLSRTADQLKRLGAAKKPEDLLNLQKDIVNENTTATMDNIQKLINTSLENMEEFSKIFNPFKESSSSMKTVEKFGK